MRINSIGNYNNSKPSFKSVHLETPGMTEKEVELVGSCLSDITKIAGDDLDLFIAKLPVIDSEGKKVPNSKVLTFIPTLVARTNEDRIDFYSKGIQGKWQGMRIIEPKFWDLPFESQRKMLLQLAYITKTDFLSR